MPRSAQCRFPPPKSWRARRGGRYAGCFGVKARWSGLWSSRPSSCLRCLRPCSRPTIPSRTSWTLVRKPPSALHWFGTDDLGRDIFGRVIYGARASLMAGVISVGIALLIGVPLGLLSGYRGGFIDALISRITDAMLACPFLILAIALAAFLGPASGTP